MINFWCALPLYTNDCNRIKTPGIVNFTIMEIVKNCISQIFHFLFINSHQWIDKRVVTTSFYLYKDYHIAMLCNYIDITML